MAAAATRAPRQLAAAGQRGLRTHEAEDRAATGLPAASGQLVFLGPEFGQNLNPQYPRSIKFGF
jgi:hypothetical protein